MNPILVSSQKLFLRFLMVVVLSSLSLSTFVVLDAKVIARGSAECQLTITQPDPDDQRRVRFAWSGHGDINDDLTRSEAEVYVNGYGTVGRSSGNDISTSGISTIFPFPTGEWEAVLTLTDASGGGCSESKTFKVNPPPTVGCQVNCECKINSFTADDRSPSYDTDTTLRFSLNKSDSWEINVLSGSQNASPSSGNGSSGTASTGRLTQSYTYRLSCGDDTRDVTVTPRQATEFGNIVVRVVDQNNNPLVASWAMDATLDANDFGDVSTGGTFSKPINQYRPYGYPKSGYSGPVYNPPEEYKWLEKDATLTFTLTYTSSGGFGNLSAENSGCAIPIGSSTCQINFSWTTLAPIGTSQVTKPQNQVVATGNSGDKVPFTITYGTNTFYLYNNASELDSETVSASCSGSSEWNGSICSPEPASPQCGNGVRTGSEQCDNGGSNGACPSTCSSSCTVNNCVASSYTVTVTPRTGGAVTSEDSQISCGSQCSKVYDRGETVTLRAVPISSYWKFAGWSGACSNTTGPCVVTVDSDKVVTPLFQVRLFNYEEF